MELTVKPLDDRDPGRGLTVVGRQTLAELALDSGDFLLVRGPDGDRAVTQIVPTDDIDDETVRTTELVRRTAGVDAGETVTVDPIEVSPADSVTVALPDGFGVRVTSISRYETNSSVEPSSSDRSFRLPCDRTR